MTKRSLPILSLTLLLSGCTALTNFGEFVFEDLGTSNDLTGADLTPPPDLACGEPATCDLNNTMLSQCGVRTVCRCIPAGTAGTIAYPAHCAPTPSNGIDATQCLQNAGGKTLTIDSGFYTVDTNKAVIFNDAGAQIRLTVISEAAVLCAGSVLANGVTLNVSAGSNAFAVIADSVVDFDGQINLAGATPTISQTTATGLTKGGSGGSPGKQGATNTTGGQFGKATTAVGSGGGGGGNRFAGGIGGKIPLTATVSAEGGAPITMPMTLEGGGGGGGAAATSGASGTGGAGGGAMQITAGAVIRFPATVNATGGAGAPGGTGAAGAAPSPGGGGGGGAGGTIWIEAPDVRLNGTSVCISVFGGPGGQGGASATGASAEAVTSCPFRRTPANLPSAGAAGGDPTAPNRYPGGEGVSAMAGSGKGGGGGAGSAGRIVIRSNNQFTQTNVIGILYPPDSLIWQSFAQ